MEKKKLLLLGAAGMAGHMAYYYLQASGKYEITNVAFRNKLTNDSILLDITNQEATEALIKKTSPDIILNCIGVLIKDSKSHPDNAIYINAYFPHLLERLTADSQTRLIHISTDCVFSGSKGDYSETDARDADDVYGKSKGLGEVLNEKDLTIRTSIIGPELKQHGEGLFHWFMNQKGNVNGYTEAYWSGVTTLELAKAIDTAIEQNVTGLVHLTNGLKISKYNLLKLFKKIRNKNTVTLQPCESKRIDKSLLKSERFKYIVPSYQKMLDEQYKWMQLNNDLYQDIYK